MRVATLLCAGLLALSMTATQAQATYSMSTGGQNGKTTLDGGDGNGNGGGFMQGLRDLLDFGAGKPVGKKGGKKGGKKDGGKDNPSRNQSDKTNGYGGGDNR